MKIGITGGTGSGKSSVARIFIKQGFVVLDADQLARDCIEGNWELRRAILGRYGNASFNADGSMNRKFLGEIVFNSAARLREYNQLIREPLLRFLEIELAGAEQAHGVAFLDAALIHEWGVEDWFDLLLLVTADESVRVQRVIQATGLDEERVRARMSLQLSDSVRMSGDHRLIENNGTLSELEAVLTPLMSLWNGERS